MKQRVLSFNNMKLSNSGFFDIDKGKFLSEFTLLNNNFKFKSYWCTKNKVGWRFRQIMLITFAKEDNAYY